MAEACAKIDWNTLPVERDPSKVEYSSYGYGRWGWDEWDYTPSSSTYSTSYKPTTPVASTEKINFWDEEYRYVSSVEIKKTTGEIVSMDLDPDRLAAERDAIYSFLEDIELVYNTMTWDGLKLKVTYSDGRVTEATRQEMEEYIDELDITEYLEDIDEKYPIQAKWNYNWD